MSGISKLLELQKDNSDCDTESQSSYETIPEEFTSEKDCLKYSERDFDFVNDDENGNDSCFDSSPGVTFCVGSDYATDYCDVPLREISNTVKQVVEERHSFVPSVKRLKSVNSSEHLGFLEVNAQLDFVGSELLKQFNLETPDVGSTEPFTNRNVDKTSMVVTDIDECALPGSRKPSRTERSSGSDDTLQYLEAEPTLDFLQSELLQRLQLVRQDSAKSDSDERDEEVPNYERSKSEQLERIVEEETDVPDSNTDIIQEILQLQESERAKSNLFEEKNKLEYPKVESIKVCNAVTEFADHRTSSLTMSGDSDSSLVINTGLSDDEEYHRIMAMADLTPDDDTDTLANLVPGSDIESEESLTYMTDSFCDEVKTSPHYSKRQLHI